jgi:hypothetical protein
MDSHQQTLKADYDLIVNLFCSALNAEYNSLTTTPTSLSNTIGKQEAEYHIKTHENSEHLSRQPLHTLLSPTYKLLTDRTLDTLYEQVFNRFIVIQPERAMTLTQNILAPGLHKWFKTMIFTAPEVNKILMPIVIDLMNHVQKEIARLDQIPYVEQKTQEWLRIRSNMISASVSGYFDAVECGCGMSKEYGQIREKSGLQPGKSIGWGSGSIRHGMTFEDLSGALYNTFNGLTSKEYGILPDAAHPCIGASPDGIVIDVADRENWQSLRKLGRMREIKNPTSRLINQRVPDTYYWQMTQQMYVCRLPLCDFIQTSFAYPNSSTPAAFIQDTLDTTPVLNATTWQKLLSALKPIEYADEEYAANTMNTTDSLILDKLDWADIITNIGREILLNQVPIQDINNVITRYVVENWDKCSKIPLANINRAGDIKGILWCFTKEDSLGGTDFEVLFMDPAVPIVSTEQIASFYGTHSVSSIQRGFKLESTHYWSCKKYLDFEVEYNQGLYESPSNSILSRLLTKWELVKSIRAEPDITSKEGLYTAFYPMYSNKGKKTAASGDKKTWGYTKRIKKGNSSAMDTMLSDIPELDLS